VPTKLTERGGIPLTDCCRFASGSGFFQLGEACEGGWVCLAWDGYHHQASQCTTPWPVIKQHTPYAMR